MALVCLALGLFLWYTYNIHYKRININVLQTLTTRVLTGNKMNSIKLISLIIVVTYFFSSIAYSMDMSVDIHLRAPVMLNTKDGDKRISETSRKINRRRFLFIASMDVLAITTVIAGIKGVLKGKEVYNRIRTKVEKQVDYYSFEHPKESGRKMQVEYRKVVKAQELLSKLSDVKYKKMTEEDTIKQCKDLDLNYDLYVLLEYLDKEEYRKWENEVLPDIVSFLVDKDVNGIDSVSAKWEINELKVSIAVVLASALGRIDYKEKEIRKRMESKIRTILLYLINNYTDNFSGQDNVFSKYFPTVNSKDLLTIQLRCSVGQRVIMIWEGKSLGQYTKPNELFKTEESRMPDKFKPFFAFRSIYGSTKTVENDIALINDAEKEAVHYVSPEDKVLIRALQKIPPYIINYCKESARKNNIPPALLISKLMYPENINYNIGEALDIVAERKAFYMKAAAKLLKHTFPKSIKERTFGKRWSDFFGGVVLNAKTRTGTMQIRPVWVRRYNGFKEFGISPEEMSKLSDREICWMLLDPKYSIAATAAMFRGIIEEVKAYRENAIKYKKLPDFSLYNKESIFSNARSELTYEYYRALPDPAAFGKEEWMIGMYHAIYDDWAVSDLGLNKLIMQSGILDGKPVKFSKDDKYFTKREGITAILSCL